ncbi:MAG: hypothetical protein JSV91_12400 [Phycisphaerales bacterium]|nr:MAG: hypothetical protein JSV91_12400 [Phycisphaerales bacterium]
MIRKVLSVLVMVALCITLSGCGGNGGGTDDAPKGGARRPAPAEPREAPGPKGGAAPAEEGEAAGGGGD